MRQLQTSSASIKTEFSVPVQLWFSISRIRTVEETIAARYSEQEMRCPTHLSTGQEAIAVGVSSALRQQDAVLSGHRAHAHYLAKGGDLSRMMAEIYGKATGCCQGRGGSMHLIDLGVNFLGSTPIVASSIPVAVGVAWAAKLKGEDKITVAFFGEGACEEGVWHESLNFASLHKLPIIFVCENNLYSVYTPLPERQPSRTLTGLAAAHGLTTYSGDGNNVLEVNKLALHAVEKAKQGPVFMELSTYRWREHCGPNFDDNLNYRPAGELLTWQQRDPLMLIEKYLTDEKLLDPVTKARLEEDIQNEVEAAFTFAKASPFPTVSTSIDDVYAI